MVHSPTPKAFSNCSPGHRPGLAMSDNQQTLKEFASVNSKRSEANSFRVRMI
jgi:hypothetical protein